jgi:hypothetical protein
MRIARVTGGEASARMRGRLHGCVCVRDAPISTGGPNSAEHTWGACRFKAFAHLMTVGATVVSMKPGRDIAGIALRSWLAVSSVSS